MNHGTLKGKQATVTTKIYLTEYLQNTLKHF